MAQQIEILLNELLINPEIYLTGVPIDFNLVPDQHKKLLLICAIHCCLNGPVGVNKETLFPTILERLRINNLYKTSNSNWRAFCKIIAEFINKKHPQIDCATKRTNGNLWPIRDWIRNQ
jgi:hypothetical protein